MRGKVKHFVIFMLISWIPIGLILAFNSLAWYWWVYLLAIAQLPAPLFYSRENRLKSVNDAYDEWEGKT